MRTSTPARALGAALLLAAVAAGCDFTPTLDVETPAFVPGVALRGFLVADSVAVLDVDQAWSPYEGYPQDGPVYGRATVITILRDGAVVERITERRDRCVDLGQPPVPPGGEIETYPCGPYAGTVPIEAGATYTLQVEAEGLPPAEATVSVPRRPTLEVTEEEGSLGERRFRVRITDPAGAGDRYGFAFLRTYTYTTVSCAPQQECVETTETRRYPLYFETSDPVLLSAAAEIDGDIAFVTFTDETFDGQTKTFTASASRAYPGKEPRDTVTVQLAALSGDVYDTYRIEYFSGGDDNPFAEPINLPSNVEGGYGLVGGLTLAEVTFETPEGAARQ